MWKESVMGMDAHGADSQAFIAPKDQDRQWLDALGVEALVENDPSLVPVESSALWVESTVLEPAEIAALLDGWPQHSDPHDSHDSIVQLCLEENSCKGPGYEPDA